MNTRTVVVVRENNRQRLERHVKHAILIAIQEMGAGCK